jgi:TolB-like protein
MMRFARHLKEAGELYYSCTDLIEEINRRRDELWRSGGGADEYQEISSAEIRELEEKVGARMRRAMSLTLAMKKEVANARLRLDNVGFEEELGILDHYIRILGRELKWEPAQLQHAAADRELPAPVRERSLANHLANLFDELTFGLRAKELKERSIVAVSGFVPAKGEAAGLVKVLNETALSNLSRIETLTLVERSRLDAVMEEQKLSLAGLTDTSTAIEVGRLLAADYLLTGSVIEMSATVVIFGRIIRVESGEIESVAQVIIPKDRDVQSLL